LWQFQNSAIKTSVIAQARYKSSSIVGKAETKDIEFYHHAVDAPFSHLGWGSSESLIDVGEIFLVFLIRSAALFVVLR